MKNLDLLAFDIGASNGRATLGRFDGRQLHVEELHRFDNNYNEQNGILRWDASYLLNQLKVGFLSYKKLHRGKLSSFGIDTWGVDYGLLDQSDRLINNPRAYRYATDNEMQNAWKIVPQKALYERTGITALNFNTIYQLHRRKMSDNSNLAKARTLLLMPDLLGFFLTGEKLSEYTNVTTTNLYNPKEKDWDYETINALSLPPHIFTSIDRAGELRGSLLPSVADELGINSVLFSAVGTHDTASAVAAIPGKGSFAFCSSGTWSLFGIETDEPIITNDTFSAGFSNEGTVQGGFRPLKNIMGLWLIQECRREWAQNGNRLSWDEIVAAAADSEAFRSIIDPDFPPFFSPGDMNGKIQKFCRDTAQPIPMTKGQIARCIYESLALKYRWAVERLENIKGTAIDSLNIVGGGAQNKLLNQMAADATKRAVIAGPIEGACIGNLLMQAVALGELKGLEDVRDVIRRSIELEVYEPQNVEEWDDAYNHLLKYMTQNRG